MFQAFQIDNIRNNFFVCIVLICEASFRELKTGKFFFKYNS